MENSAQYLISTVSKRSGVKSDLVRAWERRYQAVTPSRTDGGHRVYTDLDIARLKLLNEATNQGHSISQIARLPLDELRKLVGQEVGTSQLVASTKLAPAIKNITPATNRNHLAEDYVEKCYAAVLAFDANVLESHFEHAIVELGTQHFIENLLNPLLTRIGDRWRTGELRPVHEHMASSIVRSLTYILRNNTPNSQNAPRMIVSTPINQHHELGALLAGIIAEFKGWQVTYLGANLPAEEIAAAVRYTNAAAVTLSISYRSDELLIVRELRKLRRLIGTDVELIVGGREAGHYEKVMDEIGVLKIRDYDHFRQILEHLTEQLKSTSVIKTLS